MAAEWICDGCGKREPGDQYGSPKIFHKPYLWFERADEDGIQTACSRECIETIAKDTGKNHLVLPL